MQPTNRRTEESLIKHTLIMKNFKSNLKDITLIEVVSFLTEGRLDIFLFFSSFPYRKVSLLNTFLKNI